jgi:tetratricopeptide (TPR) repeat protein
MCEEFADDARQKSAALQFDQTALGGNVSSDLNFPSLNSESALERLGALQHLLSVGWYLLAGGVALLMWSGWRQASPRQRKSIAVVLIVVLVVGSFRGAIAELYQWRGDVALARGNHAAALRFYRSAARWNENLDDTEHIRLSRGQSSMSNEDTSADAHLFRAETFADRRDFARAMEEFAQAQQRAPQSVVIKRLWAWARVRWGLNLYREGNVHLAIQQFERAIETDPRQLQARFYLAKACYDARDEQAAIEYNLAFLQKCRDKFLRAEALSNLGDCHFRQRNFVAARQMYQRSLRQYDDVVYRMTNFRARRGLMGM